MTVGECVHVRPPNKDELLAQSAYYNGYRAYTLCPASHPPRATGSHPPRRRLRTSRRHSQTHGHREERTRTSPSSLSVAECQRRVPLANAADVTLLNAGMQGRSTAAAAADFPRRTRIPCTKNTYK